MGSRGSSELLYGVLDLLIMSALSSGPRHGYAIANYLNTASEDVFQVGDSSLYTALQRLLLRGWVRAHWGTSENNRRARYYTLSVSGRKQWDVERARFDRIVLAIHRILATSAETQAHSLDETRAIILD